MLPRFAFFHKSCSNFDFSHRNSDFFFFFPCSFLDCYASEFTVLNTVEEGEGGVPLEHLITCVPGVNIVTAQNGIKVVKWVHNNPPPPNAGKVTCSPFKAS